MAKKKEAGKATPKPADSVMLSARVPPDLYQKIIVAAATRRAARATPYTVQDIVIEALRGWLTAHGPAQQPQDTSSKKG